MTQIYPPPPQSAGEKLSTKKRIYVKPQLILLAGEDGEGKGYNPSEITGTISSGPFAGQKSSTGPS